MFQLSRLLGISFGLLAFFPAPAQLQVYEWAATEWSPCTEECRGGTQTRLVICRNVDNERDVFIGDCPEAGERPAEQQVCNTHVRYTGYVTMH